MTAKDSGKYAQHVDWRGRWLCLRPLRGEDASRYADFIASLDRARIGRSTFALLPEPADIAAMIANGDRRNVTYVALLDDAAGTLLGIARAARGAKDRIARLAVVLRADVEGKGLGRLLMGKIVADCRASGIVELVGETTLDNRRMIELARAFRFVDSPSRVPGFVSLRLRFKRSAQEE